MFPKKLIIILVLLISTVDAVEAKVDIGGAARVRWEYFEDISAPNQATDTQFDFIGSRFRMDFLATVNPNIQVFFQPQFTRVFGGEEKFNAGQSSGSLKNPSLGVFAAYLQYTFDKSWGVYIGRQGLNYGDQRVIGTVGWRNDSRAFDALRVRKSYGDGKSWTDVFLLQLEEENQGVYGGATTLGPDNETYGIYSHLEGLGPVNIDVYILYNSNKGGEKRGFASFGALLKGKFGDLDFGLEATLQSAYDANQVDLEAGYKFGGTRLFAAYGRAHKDYQQLYPTAHKFLGHADLFGRRNINEVRVGLASKLNDTMTAKLTYHNFSRSDDNLPYYNLGGAAVGTGTESTKAALADEVDFSWKWMFVEKAHVLIGGAYVMPGGHLKKLRGGDDPGIFTYVQTGTSF